MLTIQILNDGTGTEECSNYTYDVFVNRDKIESGDIRGHNRKDGWRNLLKLMVEDDEENK